MTDLRKRIFKIIQIGHGKDPLSVAFDVFISVAILSNLFVVFFETFSESAKYINILSGIELVTIIIFTIEYILRVATADLLYPNEKITWKAVMRFVLSFYGVVDLLSFLPYWMPVVFPAGIVAFRMLRVIRILRLFRINAYYDAFNVITDVIHQKASQILSAIFIIAMMAVSASLIMYGLEHEAQPDVFDNAFSGIWWAVSTLLTVGYGDIYPITAGGKIVGIILAFLGVGIVAIPTGIISAGFVEQYTKVKYMSANSYQCPVDFVTIKLEKGHEYIGKRVGDISLMQGMVLVAIIRDGESLVASRNLVLEENDKLAIGAKALKDENDFTLEEVAIRQGNEWIGGSVERLNSVEDMVIVMLKRDGRIIIPNDNLKIKLHDEVVTYRRKMRL